MKQIFDFLRHPVSTIEFRNPSFGEFFLLLFGYFIMIIPIAVIVFILSQIFEFSFKTVQVTYNQRILYGLLIGPLIEETLFRLNLVFNKRNLVIVCIVSLGLAIWFIFKSEPIKTYMFLSIGLFVVLLLLFFTKTSKFFNQKFSFFFYALALLFASLHIFNFSGIISAKYILLAIIVLPQFILAVFLGYVRMAYGFFYAVAFHAIANISMIF